MKREDFEEVTSAKAFVERLEGHGLYREEDVTFEEIGEDRMYVYRGDDFHVDADLLASMDISGLLVEGSVEVDLLSVSDILPDFGVFCVTGDVRCMDMLCVTECTGMAVGGDLVIGNAFYADCGNSVIQVNGDLRAKVFFNAQCSIDVHGTESTELDEGATAEQLAMAGIPVGDDEEPDDAVERYFDKYEA